MAQASDHFYLPPLGECLKGGQEVISWKLAATALSDPAGARQTSDAISEFLKDPFVRDLIKNPSKTFAARDDAANAQFETKTAAINVTPSSNNKYDIKTIKEDAQWLGKNAKLNLVAALRIVLIELQSRPASHLAGQLSLQDELNLKDAAGENEAQASGLAIAQGGADSADAESLWEKFQKEESRRVRIFLTYLSERRSFMMTVNYLYSVIFYGRLPIGLDTPPSEKLAQRYGLPRPVSGQDDLEGRRAFVEDTVTTYLDVLARLTDEFENSLGAITDDATIATEEVALEWSRTALDQVVNAVSVIYQALDFMDSSMVNPKLVARWFSMMDGHCFFTAYGTNDDVSASMQSALQTVSCAISLTLLSPATTMAHLAGEAEGSGEDMLYLTSPQVMEDIHAAVSSASSRDSSAVYPTIFVWSIILLQLNLSLTERSEKRDLLLQQKSAELLQANASRPEPTRRSSVGSIISIEELPRDVFLRSSGLDKDVQAIESLAQQVTGNGAVYEVLNQMALVAGELSDGILPVLHGSRVRHVFTDFLKWTHPFVGYQSEPVSTLLACLSGGASYWNIPPHAHTSPDTDILAIALHDDELLGNYLEESLNRFPMEFSPFLRITTNLARCTSLGDADRSELVLRLLHHTPTITFNFPPTFQAFELAFEDENTNSFRLLEPLPIFSPRNRTRRHTAVDDFCIPEGSLGRFVTDSGRVVFMEYKHSALALLGTRLQISMVQTDYDLLLGGLAPEEMAETITLLATLIRAEYLKFPTTDARRYQRVTDIVEEASKSIDNAKDIISVICDILDVSMQDEEASNEGQNLCVITACVQFLHAALPVFPSRILSYMARCGLLNSDSHAGKLARLTGKLDMGPDQFEFLISTVRLFSAVVDAIMSSSIRRKGLVKSSSRSNAEHDAWLGTSDSTLSGLGYAIARATVDVFENSSTWKFGSHAYPTLLVKDIVPIMRKFIQYAYGLDDFHGANRPTASLELGAEYVIDSFLSPSAGSLRFRPLLNTIDAGRENHMTTLYHTKAVASQHQVTAVLDLATTLLRVATLYDRPVGLFEAHLFKTSGLLARLVSANDHFKRPTLLLLDALVESAGRRTDEPPSLLGYLGPQVAKSFLDVLAKIDKPFSSPAEVTTTWRFFSSIVRNRQQWMSNCLITGKTPREVSDADKVKDFASESVFATALATLKEIGALSRLEALGILDFVTSAQNYWPWTVFTILKDPACFDGLRSRIRKMSSAAITAKSDPLGAAYDAKEAAYIAEAFAMQLYHLRHMGGAEKAAGDLLQDLDYYLRDGAAISGYNASLHSNFRKNFANKYPGCSVEKFKRALLEPRDLGDNYYYDLAMADDMLRFDPGWLGPKGNNGFKAEMERANLNLSLVDAQISLYHAWEFLLLQISSSLPGNKVVARYMQQTALQCLEANRDTLGPENIFVRIIESRSNFALSLIQGLIGFKLEPQDVNQLISSLYSAITRIDEPFAEDSAPLYRTLLKALYIVLKSHAGEPTESTEDGAGVPAGALVPRIQMVLNTLDNIVGKGFRTLVTLIHDKNPTVSPEDLSLITATLQACLGVPETDKNQTQIINIMASHDAAHVASSLFSWSDKITGENGDPVYGELSLLFLLELSKLPLVAEQLACGGILGQLASANLTRFMRRATVSPFAENVAAQRCYSIWAKAMLPLLLNLLTAMGATVAPEVGNVLNQFPALLKSSVERFEAPGTNRTAAMSSAKEARHYVTFLTAMEVHSLALLTKVLGALRDNNNRDIPEVKWDAGSAVEYVEFWLTSRRLLRERLLPLGQREVEWKGMRGRLEGESLLEERVVGQLEAVRDILSEES
ncbi:related to nucleoporin nup184 [Cephalotrichum gorgonifer]|uniref:Nucleoporin NUP188 n=1 Tax=Cephalotrichum gorgonifer TaxID=2041049 RepID=A0AAE8N027_9PEZI|nr:related to nucleoporin nup184 [Cephalotrichum gorgonifer]